MMYNKEGLKKLDREAENIGLPLKFITRKREPIFNEYSGKSIKKYIQCIGGEECNICRQTGKKGSCMMYYIVYAIKCKKCIEELMEYLGGTNRAFYRRIKEHEEHIKKLNKNASALAQHLVEKHQLDKKLLEELKNGNKEIMEEFFDIKVDTKNKHPMDTWIMEAEKIWERNPKINRKNEKYMMWVDREPNRNNIE